MLPGMLDPLPENLVAPTSPIPSLFNPVLLSILKSSDIEIDISSHVWWLECQCIRIQHYLMCWIFKLVCNISTVHFFIYVKTQLLPKQLHLVEVLSRNFFRNQNNSKLNIVFYWAHWQKLMKNVTVGVKVANGIFIDCSNY